MKKTFKFYACRLVVFFIGLFVIIGCGTDDTDSFTSKPEGTFTDPRDGQTYRWIRIGEQVWMAENLNYASADSWCYDNNTMHCDHYGRLYTWYAAMNGAPPSNYSPSGVEGVCPPGWHVPSDNQWHELVNYVDAMGFPNEMFATNGAGNALKSCRQVDSPLGGSCNTSTHPRWAYPEVENVDGIYGIDAFGFSALPGGQRCGYYGSFDFLGEDGGWWTTAESSSTLALHQSLFIFAGSLIRSPMPKSYGRSLRCVRNN